jgi:phage terminase large subunit-like protein
MNELSDDLLQAIFQELDAVTLLALSQVSKDFRDAADSDSTWIWVHGFTKTETLTVITESKRRIRELGDLLWIARRAEQKAGEIFMRAEPRDFAVEEQKRLDLTNAHRLWRDTTGNLDKATRDLSVASQLLRVPLAMRLAATSARFEYYAELKKAHRKKLDVSSIDAVRSRLTKINQDVALLVDEKAMGTQTTFWWVATCCARSIWANPDEPLIMTD